MRIIKVVPGRNYTRNQKCQGKIAKIAALHCTIPDISRFSGKFLDSGQVSHKKVMQ